MKKEWLKHEHLIRGIPNNFFTRWTISLVNKRMAKSQSCYRLKRKYRQPKDGFKYSYGGGLKCENAKSFSVYLKTLESVKSSRRMSAY